MIECGRVNVRSASITRRFMRCLVTERRAVFLDTTTAYPSVFLETTALKFAEDTLLPLFSADGKSERESRFRRGNTVRITPSSVYGRFCGVFALFYALKTFRSASGIRASSLSYVFSVGMFVSP